MPQGTGAPLRSVEGVNFLVEPVATRDNKVVPWGDLSTGYGNNDLVAMHTHAVSGSMTMPEGALHPIRYRACVVARTGPSGRRRHDHLLASELMFFAALFAAYFTIRNVTNSPAAATGRCRSGNPRAT